MSTKILISCDFQAEIKHPHWSRRTKSMCDGCKPEPYCGSVEEFFTDSIEGARLLAAREDWLRVDGLDICPQHALDDAAIAELDGEVLARPPAF